MGVGDCTRLGAEYTKRLAARNLRRLFTRKKKGERPGGNQRPPKPRQGQFQWPHVGLPPVASSNAQPQRDEHGGVVGQILTFDAR